MARAGILGLLTLLGVALWLWGSGPARVVLEPGVAPEEAPRSAASSELRARSRSEAEPVDARAPVRAPDAAPTLSGIARHPGGPPARGMRLVAESSGTTARTDAEGRFALTLAAGVERERVAPHPEDGVLLAGGEWVSGAPSDLELAVAWVSPVAVRVEGPAGEPMAGVRVEAFGWDVLEALGLEDPWEAVGTSDGQGRVRLQVPIDVHPEFRARAFELEASGFGRDPEGRTVVLRLLPPIPNVPSTDRTGQVEGRVVDVRGIPLEGVEVSPTRSWELLRRHGFLQYESWWTPSATDADGCFRVTWSDGDPVLLQFSGPAGLVTWESTEVRDGDPARDWVASEGALGRTLPFRIEALDGRPVAKTICEVFPDDRPRHYSTRPWEFSGMDTPGLGPEVGESDAFGRVVLEGVGTHGTWIQAFAPELWPECHRLEDVESSGVLPVRRLRRAALHWRVPGAPPDAIRAVDADGSITGIGQILLGNLTRGSTARFRTDVEEQALAVPEDAHALVFLRAGEELRRVELPPWDGGEGEAELVVE